MTNDTRTSEEIERDIAEERAQMTGTINDLQKKFSVDAIVNDLGDMFRGQTGELGHKISHAVGRNPAAVVLVGVGLAWLLIGKDRNHSANESERHWNYGYDRRNMTARTQWDDRALPKRQSSEGSFHDEDDFWYGDRKISRTGRSQAQGAARSHQDPFDMDEGSDGMQGTIRDATSAVGNAISDATDSLGDMATRVSARLSHGLEDFSEEAKSRILAARHAAHEARVASTAAMNRGSRAASNLFEEQPLVVGALAVAVGAAIGGALPHSRFEDDTMGESSDRLFAEAQAVFREERDKAMAVARAAASDVRDEIGDMGSELRSEVESLLPEAKNLGEMIVDRAAGAASRVIEGAQDEAKRQADTRPES